MWPTRSAPSGWGSWAFPAAAPTLWPAARCPRWPLAWPPPWQCWAGIVPSVGPEATEGVIDDFARRFEPMLSELRRPLAALSFGLLAPLIPVSHYVLRAYSSIQPEGDQRVFADPEMKAVFVDDILLVVKARCQAVIDDVRLFGPDWDFWLADVKVPVRWWHGDADPVVPLTAAQTAVSHLPDAELILRQGESHLGGFAKADEVLEFIASLL